ncbi:DNA repair protein RecN [Phorcysia thermohydrogeniphila]|uniref:DNA repair protein RecN n=1 Tax=Phorcysia thermohydrogeniphila TaxID=936138 RepID=A0A4R1GB15_9BACT|nr:AAA family ATPase [Phorcysia thermohydrogeniphila]TCK03903.1 DNA replication and repair protein RecN [Phorcysia thermohydrogeniphila]
MIEELRLYKFGLISAELSFSPGFNVIIGETGAGKSLLLSSIDFLKGAKSDVVSEGSFVEAVFSFEDEEVFVRREIKGGRSRYFLNGMRVPQKLVEEKVARFLIFQSQRQSIELLKPSYQIEVLDRVSGVSSLLESYKELYHAYREKQKELESLKADAAEKEREIDILKFQIEEIESANLREGEEEELLELKKVVSQAEKVKSLRELVRFNLYDGEGAALEKIGEVLSSLEELEMFSDLVKRLSNLYYELEAVYFELEKRLEVPDEDISLEAIEDRLYEIERIKRKYGGSLEKVKEFLERSKERLEVLENLDFELEKKEKELEELRRELQEISAKISAKRKAGAKELKAVLIDSFRELKMESARFEVLLEELPDFTPKGKDRVTFLFSGNPKLSLSPLSDSISGGELSRFLLSVLALFSFPEVTMVFDEIDAGMSGKVLTKVAGKLRDIAKSQQVIAVTHSPQVVAAADRVFKVEKSPSGSVTVRVLDEEEKKKEIAIMISGDVSEGSLRAADELIKKWEE